MRSLGAADVMIFADDSCIPSMGPYAKLTTVDMFFSPTGWLIKGM